MCVATDNDIPIGVFICRHYCFKGIKDDFNGILGVYVKDDYRNKGVAKQMMTSWIDYSKPTIDENDHFLSSKSCFSMLQGTDIKTLEYGNDESPTIIDAIEKILK